MYDYINNIRPEELESHKRCGKEISRGVLEIDENSDCWKQIIADRIQHRAANPDPEYKWKPRKSSNRNQNTLEEFHSMWDDFHTKLDADEEWDVEFDKRLLCGVCRGHWAKIRAENKPVYGTGRFEYTVMMHDLVNTERKVRPFGIDAAREKYKPAIG